MRQGILYFQLLFLILSCILVSGCNENLLSHIKVSDRPPDIGEIDTVHTIAFGSCNYQDHDQPHWRAVLETNPDLWIWLGDIIYGDTDNMEVLKEKYQKQFYHKDYIPLRASVPVAGIWDDHDYGVNNGGKEYPKRQQSRDLLFTFLQLDSTTEAWSHEGAYQSYTIGLPPTQVKVILLDSRYFRDPPPYKAGEATILGETQWRWLEKELQSSAAQIHIIGNGIQVIPEDHRYEKWGNFPDERIRLLHMIDSLKVANPVLISGDRHLSEVSMIQWGNDQTKIYEVTSSGLTHSYEEGKGEYNRHRVGNLITKKSFAVIRINWEKAEPEMTAILKGIDGTVYESILLE